MVWIPIVIGFFILFCGAELLIRSAIQVARYFRFSKLVIGLTLVAFLAAAPEALISVFGHIQNNQGDIALSNVIGSNIANIGLVLGLYLFLHPVVVSHELKWHKMPILFVVYLLLFLVMVGGKISRIEGIYLFIVLIFYGVIQYYFHPSEKRIQEKIKAIGPKKKKHLLISVQVIRLIASALLLIFGTYMLLSGAVKLGKHYGLSDRIMHLSLLAFGTSLPELATGLVAALRKETDIFVGTIIGSSILNPLLILPLATWFGPIYFSPKLLTQDFPLMVAISLLLFVLMLLGKNKLSRSSGTILLASYVSYVAFLFFS